MRPRAIYRARIDWSAYLYLAPAFLLALLFSFFSMGVSFWTSLHDWDPFAGGGRFVGLENYRRVLFGVDSVFWIALRNTTLYVGMVLAGMLATSLPLALLCRKARYLQGVFRTLYFLPSITPGVVVALIFYQLFGIWGQLLDKSATALGAIALMGVWSGTGYNMLIFLAGLHEIPSDFYDAARIDGAGTLAEFRHVTIPLLRNTLVFVMVMTIIGAYQVFTSVFVMTQGGPERSTEVLAFDIFMNAFSVAGQMGYASAAAWLLFVVIGVFVFLQMRLLRSRRIYDE
ncbi:MAG TPA: sugar ABC transporter permease [Chthonomonadaceae bacterium]|nr:sugar ABC transporter permease [Chthonomonadaceae bacterium]